jgi:HK97 family phage prohead protease
METERRVVEETVEVRAGKDGAPTITGYAAVFNSMSEDLGGFREVIRPDAFTKSLEGTGDVLARAEHDSKMLLGRRSTGTLKLSVDERGLLYEINPPDTQAGRDVVTLIKRGDVKQSSFAFRVPDAGDSWDTGPDGLLLRELLNVELVDVAPVAMPAYQATTVSARALEHVKGTQPPPILPGVPNEVNEARQRLAEAD